jgi:6-phosphogluconolactonase
MSTRGTTLVLVGTYTNTGSEGIYLFQLDDGNDALSPAGVCGGISNPSYLAVHPSEKFVYAVSEGGADSQVVALRLEHDKPALEIINSQPAHGTSPCHVTVDATGRCVLIANYGDGSAAAFPVREDGSLAEVGTVIRHEGSSAHPTRQTGPHAHSVTLDPGNRHAYIADLGIDRVMIYDLDPTAAKLTPASTPWAQVPPGEGPRHFAFHPAGRYAYLLTELGNTVIVFAHDAVTGALEPLQSLPSLPPDFAGTSYGADIQVDPRGEFVYASNRGHDSLVVYSVDGATGMLTLRSFAPSGGRNPRGFGIAAGGELLLVANQDSDNIVAFRLNRAQGTLEPTGAVTSVPRPVCVKLVSR